MSVNSESVGSLEKLIIGPMFSGKTTELKRMIRRHIVAQHKCLTIRYNKDQRYHDKCIVTHDMEVLNVGQSITCGKLSDIKELIINEYDVIAIDEGQFFEDIYEQVHKFVIKYGKIVIISSLDGWHDMEPCINVLRLIPLSNKTVKLSAICSFCKSKNGSCSFKYTDATATTTNTTINVSDSKIDVGGSEKYKAACLKCYYKNK